VTADPSPATEELAFASTSDLRHRMESGELTSEELVETLIRRIEDLDSPGSATELRSVLAVSEQAIEEARRSDRRRASASGSRPLEGLPVLVKDNVEVVGLPSSAGATSLVGRPPTADAPLVARLRDAGAVILGSTNLSQWANIRSSRSSGGWSAVGGLTGNPWSLDRNAGGSSSGSGAALAAGLAPLAIGTETDGSITCPCSLNGVAGIKPAVGAVPAGQVVPISFSQDSPGPMARTAADVATMLEVLADRGGMAIRVERDLPGLRVGVAEGWGTGHPGTDELFESAVDRIRSAGAMVVSISPAVPSEEAEDDELIVLLCELKTSMDLYLPTRGPGGPQNLVEVIAHEDDHRDVEQPWFGHDLFERAVQLGGCDTEVYRYARARNRAWALETCLDPAMEKIDVLVAPTYGPAWKSDLVLGGHPAAAAPTTKAPAIAGWPIATVPMGLVSDLPVGMGIVGRPGSEADLLAVGAVVERPERPTWAMPRRG
jgi:amidase